MRGVVWCGVVWSGLSAGGIKIDFGNCYLLQMYTILFREPELS